MVILDIAIGAPYEDSSGVLYVYNGYREGVWPKYTQRIAASLISSTLNGFGISISNAADTNFDDIQGMSQRQNLQSISDPACQYTPSSFKTLIPTLVNISYQRG